MIWSPVIRNVRYDDMGFSRNIEFFNDTAGPATDWLRQRYDFVASRHTEKVRNNGVETYTLLKLGIAFPAINFYRRGNSP